MLGSADSSSEEEDHTRNKRPADEIKNKVDDIKPPGIVSGCQD